MDTITSDGETIVKEKAIVKNITVQGGYTKLLDYANIDIANLLNSGTLEISRYANVMTLNRKARKGKLIDHRPAAHLPIIIWIVIIFAIIILVIIFLVWNHKRRRKLNKYIKTELNVT